MLVLYSAYKVGGSEYLKSFLEIVFFDNPHGKENSSDFI